MSRIVAALIFVIVTSSVALADGLPIPSYWLNQRGSEMKLFSSDAQGNFGGVFINHAAGFACQNTPYDLGGHIWGDRVKFVVVWKNFAADCHSKTIWRGWLIGNTLHTRWVLISDNPDGTITKLHGFDVFQLQP
jgi:hypothetical protein